MYRRKRFQNKVCTSSFLLPVCAVVCVLLWLLVPPIDTSKFIGLAFCGITTALMIELNNTNMLIRVRSRMVSATFVMLWSACQFLHPFGWSHVAALCMMICYHALFHSYQQMQAMNDAFIIFLSLGICSLIIPPMVVVALPFLIALWAFRAMSIRAFFACILGFITPLWIVLGWLYFKDGIPDAIAYYTPLLQLDFATHALEPNRIWAFCFVVGMALISSIHFMRTNFQDKIRVRMLFYFLLWMQLIWVAMMVLFSQQFDVYFLLYIMTVSPLIAHFFTLSNTWVSNAFFVLCMILFFAFTGCNIWMPSFSF